MTTPPVNEITPAWTSFIDLDDAKSFMQWPATDSEQDQLLQDTIDAACWWAQDFLGRPIALTEFFRRFSGWSSLNGAYLDLPYYPVVVDSSHPITVVEYWGSSGPHTLTQQTPTAQGPGDMYQIDNLAGTLIRSFQGLVQRPWFPGLRNIEVTWWAGYNPTPPTWKRGTLRLIKHWWNHDMQAQVVGFAKETESGPSAEFFELVPRDIEQVFATGLQVGLG